MGFKELQRFGLGSPAPVQATAETGLLRDIAPACTLLLLPVTSGEGRYMLMSILHLYYSHIQLALNYEFQLAKRIQGRPKICVAR